MTSLDHLLFLLFISNISSWLEDLCYSTMLIQSGADIANKQQINDKWSSDGLIVKLKVPL